MQKPHTASRQDAFKCYRGIAEDGTQYLLTVWADGVHDLSIRAGENETWGRIMQLTPIAAKPVVAP